MSDEDVLTDVNENSNEQEELENALRQEDEEGNETQEEVTSSPDEERAKKYGHISKEDWIASGKDPSLWKSPAEFNKTGEVIEQLYTLKKKVDQRDREIQALIDYQQRTAQREFERAKKELESQLAASKNDMDMDGVAHYTKELVRLEENENLTHAQHTQQLQRQAREAFIERNQHWFNDRNPDLQQRAYQIDQELAKKYPTASLDDLSEMLEAKMLAEHPERVMVQRINSRPNVSQSGVNKTAVVKKESLRNLSQEHRDTYNVYKRINPNITEADFIARLKADGEI